MSIFSKPKAPVAPVKVEERSIADWTKSASPETTIPNTGIAAFFAAVQLISNSIAQLPLVVKVDGTVDELHPYNTMFDNDLHNRFTFMKALCWDLLLRGKAFAYIAERKNGVATKLKYLQSSKVTVNYNDVLDILNFTSQQVKGVIQPKDMLYFYLNSSDGINGKAISSFADKILKLAKLTESQAESFVAGGGSLYGILTITGNPSQEEVEKIRYSWRQLHSGEGQTGIAILKNGMQYQAISSSAAEAQMLESREFGVLEIARLFNINPALLGDLSHSTYNSIEQATLEFLVHTLQPYITMVESEMRKKLCIGTNISIDLDETYLLRSDKASMASYLNSLVNTGIMTRNEARKQLGLPPVDGADALIVAYTDISQNTIGETENNK